MDIQQTIRRLAKENFAQTVCIRQHLHQNPELSFKEHKTADYVASVLDDLKIPYKRVTETGLIGRIEGKNPDKKVIALRADLDALPITEDVDCGYKSQNEGVMHACGHDLHTASLLGTARILNELKNEFEGTILLIFQPGEESHPGGARLMLDAGALDNPRPSLILGQHVLPEMPTGKVGFRSGMMMASADEIYLTVKGKGGHGALPHTLVDSVLIASHIIVALQQIVSRNIPAMVPTLLSFGKFIANGATNVLPDKVEIAGTLRTMDETCRATAKEKIRQIATLTAQAMGGECEVMIKDGYPSVINDNGITQQCFSFAREFMGEENVSELEMRMTAEDFGFFTQQFPCSFYRFGVARNDGKPTGTLHNAKFNPNEEALETSSALMAWLAFSFISK